MSVLFLEESLPFPLLRSGDCWLLTADMARVLPACRSLRLPSSGQMNQSKSFPHPSSFLVIMAKAT